MKDLIQLYRTAFLEGNDEVLGEVEKAITAVEKEKSRVASQFESITTEVTSGKEKFTSNIRVEVVQSLLPLVDSFEKTNLENTPETEKEQKISTSYQGIYKQLVETLRYLGVGVVETVGKPFDPSVSNNYPSVTCFIPMASLKHWMQTRNNILDPFEHAKGIPFWD
jgi:molecular chaperone GrpE (heat shock protein)